MWIQKAARTLYSLSTTHIFTTASVSDVQFIQISHFEVVETTAAKISTISKTYSEAAAGGIRSR